MNLQWSAIGWDEYLYWQKHDKAILKRVNKLIKETLRNPFSGVGNPESLKHEFSGYWSRRITQEHRLVYTVKGDTVIIVQCRHHY